MTKKVIVHITTVHPRRDTRIFYRECLSVKKLGYECILMVADGMGNEVFEGITILDLGKETNRVNNFLKNYFKILKKVKELKPILVHFHDPELIFVGARITGIPVIFDIHENIPSQILDKPYIPKILRKPVSFFYSQLENILIKKFHLILAEYSYNSRYRNKGESVTTILNMPDIEHFKIFESLNRSGCEMFYIGEISDDRGIHVILEALRILHKRGVPFFMHMVGPMTQKTQSEINTESISDRVRFYGRMDSRIGFELSRKCIAGISILKPIKNFIGSYSTKIFEYMAIGLPVITSNFPLYIDVVDRHDCGFCIDPNSPKELANRMEFLIKSESEVKRMGLNGTSVIKSHYNWATEEEKLKGLYVKATEKKISTK